MGIPILKVRDKNGNFVGIPALRGEKGKDGTMTFSDLTPEQKDSLRGEDGKDGSDGSDGKDGLTPQIIDGYWWIGNTFTGVKAVSDIQVSTGSYTGTGNNSVSLSFDFSPKFVLISGGETNSEFGFLFPHASSGQGFEVDTSGFIQTVGLTCHKEGEVFSILTLFNVLSGRYTKYSYVAIG